MEIGDRENLAAPLGEPPLARRSLTLRAMPVAAGVVGDPGCAAIVALFDMAAERSRAAGGDGAHDASFHPTDVAGVCLAKQLAVAAEDVRHIQSGRHDPASGGRNDFDIQAIERALRLADRGVGNQRITCGRRQMSVAEQHLDDADVRAILQKMRRKAVPQDMHGDALVEREALESGLGI